jgi:hypothetical protein
MAELDYIPHKVVEFNAELPLCGIASTEKLP